MSQNQIKCEEQKENSEHAWKTLFERKNWKYDLSYLTNWWLDFEIKLKKCLTKYKCIILLKKKLSNFFWGQIDEHKSQCMYMYYNKPYRLLKNMVTDIT